jgi:hypothetical protein
MKWNPTIALASLATLAFMGASCSSGNTGTTGGTDFSNGSSGAGSGSGAASSNSGSGSGIGPGSGSNGSSGVSSGSGSGSGSGARSEGGTGSGSSSGSSGSHAGSSSSANMNMGDSGVTVLPDGGINAPPEVMGCTSSVKLYKTSDDMTAPGPWPVGVKTVQLMLSGVMTNVEVWYPAPLGSDAGKQVATWDVRNWLPSGRRTAPTLRSFSSMGPARSGSRTAAR